MVLSGLLAPTGTTRRTLAHLLGTVLLVMSLVELSLKSH